jgi:hypothetical protein
LVGARLLAAVSVMRHVTLPLETKQPSWILIGGGYGQRRLGVATVEQAAQFP